MDDDPIRALHRLYQQDGLESLAGFGYEGSERRLNQTQWDYLKHWITPDSAM